MAVTTTAAETAVEQSENLLERLQSDDMLKCRSALVPKP